MTVEAYVEQTVDLPDDAAWQAVCTCGYQSAHLHADWYGSESAALKEAELTVSDHLLYDHGIG